MRQSLLKNLLGCGSLMRLQDGTLTFSSPHRPGLTALAGWALLAAMNNPAAAEQNLALSPDVVARGKLSIANTVDYAPFGYLDAEGKPAGIIIELAAAAADRMGVELEVQRSPFAALMPGLASGRFSIAWETFSVTPERLAHVDFVVFMAGGLAASTRPELQDEVSREWGICGRQVGVSSGSASDFLVDKLSAACTDNGAEPIQKALFNTSQDIIQAVLSGRIDVRIDDATASSYFQTVSLGQLVVLPTQYDVSPLALAVAKGDTDNAQMLVLVLQTLFDDGTYAEALERYGMSAHAVAGPYFVDSMDDLRAP